MQSNKTLLTSSVLIVDDDIEALEEMADALQDYGLIVYTASNESMALELALRHRPEFIIMDYFLHGFTGIEVIKVIHNSLPEIQVIMISGFEDLSRLITTTNSDVISVLKKPLSIDSIGCYIFNQLEQKNQKSKLAIQ
jgi:DNA-binding NtrC family response regulator